MAKKSTSKPAKERVAKAPRKTGTQTIVHNGEEKTLPSATVALLKEAGEDFDHVSTSEE
jgi:hypothetical protein